jgi:vacuolar-type H+-ATPase subunit H
MAEDELEVLIAESVQMATKAAALAAEKSLEAVKDGTVDEKEQEILYTYWYYAEEMIAYANDGFVVYYDKFADLTAGTLAPLKAVDADLQTISQQAQVVLPILEQIGQALEQGTGQKDKVLRQIETAAETVQVTVADAQSQAQTWTASLQPAAQQRVEKVLAVKPRGVAKNRKEAINKANNYIKTVRAACADKKITQAELAKIAQQGANAAASLTKKGGAQFAGLADSVNEITTQIASGQLPAAQTSLDSFQAALSAKP